MGFGLGLGPRETEEVSEGSDQRLVLEPRERERCLLFLCRDIALCREAQLEDLHLRSLVESALLLVEPALLSFINEVGGGGGTKSSHSAFLDTFANSRE